MLISCVCKCVCMYVWINKQVWTNQSWTQTYKPLTVFHHSINSSFSWKQRTLSKKTLNYVDVLLLYRSLISKQATTKMQQYIILSLGSDIINPKLQVSKVLPKNTPLQLPAGFLQWGKMPSQQAEPPLSSPGKQTQQNNIMTLNSL